MSYEEYYPYGGTSYIAHPSGADNKTVASRKRYRYSGKERDDETGMYYYGARYYAPFLGRWVSADPVGKRDGLNLFVFVRGNPVSSIDSVGHQTEDGQDYWLYQPPLALGKTTQHFPTSDHTIYVRERFSWYERLPGFEDKLSTVIPDNYKLNYESNASSEEIKKTLDKANTGDIVILIGHSHIVLNPQGHLVKASMETDDIIGPDEITSEEIKSALTNDPPTLVMILGCNSGLMKNIVLDSEEGVFIEGEPGPASLEDRTLKLLNEIRKGSTVRRAIDIVNKDEDNLHPFRFIEKNPSKFAPTYQEKGRVTIQKNRGR